MDDLTTRLVVVGVTVVAVVVLSLVLRHLRSRPRRSIATTGLRPGTYLFTSAGCEECDRARRLLADRSGVGGFVEVAWERDPAVFDRLGVDAVPSTLIVAENGSGVWHAGIPRNP